MNSCLPATGLPGGTILLLVTIALTIAAIGVVLLRHGRRRGFGTALVLALALVGGASLSVAPPASADTAPCGVPNGMPGIAAPSATPDDSPSPSPTVSATTAPSTTPTPDPSTPPTPAPTATPTTTPTSTPTPTCVPGVPGVPPVTTFTVNPGIFAGSPTSTDNVTTGTFGSTTSEPFIQAAQILRLEGSEAVAFVAAAGLTMPATGTTSAPLDSLGFTTATPVVSPMAPFPSDNTPVGELIWGDFSGTPSVSVRFDALVSTPTDAESLQWRGQQFAQGTVITATFGLPAVDDECTSSTLIIRGTVGPNDIRVPEVGGGGGGTND